MRVTVTTANICGNPLRVHVFVRRRMRQALTLAGVVFGQEVARSNRWGLRRLLRRAADYSEMWRRVAKSRGKTTYGGPHEVPISVPESYDVVGHEVDRAHGGKAGVSPARYINTVRTVITDNRVAFVDCHPPSKPRRGVPFARWRISRWNLYLEKLAAIVDELHAEGFTVVFGGDMNKRLRAMPEVHPGQQLLISSGLDHLWVVPAEGKSATVTHRRKIRRTVLMDHAILSATFDLRSAA